jgi:ABC-type transport system substrate-binding protein
VLLAKGGTALLHKSEAARAEKSMTRWLTGVGSIGLILALGTAVAAQDARERTLVMAVPGTPASIDGEQALTSEGEMIMANVHGGDLFSYKIIEIADDPADTVDLRSTDDRGVTGLTAESWEMSEDGKTVTVKLKQGMKSPYGNELDADDYVWSWERRFEVKGVGKFMADVLGIDGPQSVEKIDDRTVRIQLRGPTPILYKILAQNYYGGPFDSDETRQHATADEPWAKEWLRTNSAGFGPYHVERVVPGVETILVKNPNWTGEPEPYFERVILKAVPESSARLALLKAGQIDIAWGLNERELKEVASDANLQVVRAQSNKQLYLGLVTDKPPFDNKKLRQAMAWATPYDDIIDKVYFGNARRMTSIVPDIYAGYVPTYAYETDLEKAKQLMAEAGFPDGFEVTLSYNAAQRESEEVAVLVKSSWEQVGVSVELQALPTAVWAEQKYGKKLQAFAENEQWPWSGDPGYSSWVYLGNGPDNFINGVNYNNPEYNALLEQAMRMLDSPEREAVTEQLQEIVAEDVPWSQIAWFDWTVAAKKDLTGFLWTPDNQIRFAYIRRQ